MLMLNPLKKFIIALLAVLLAAPAVQIQAESVYRFAVLEALIANHKALSNRLRDRRDIDMTVTVATYRTTDETDNYEEMVRTMQQRIEGAQSNVQFSLDLASLTSMAVKTAQLSSDAVGYALDKAGDNPLIIDATVQVVNQTASCINTIYKLVAMAASSGSNVVLATNEDRTQFCFIIRTQLQRIQNLMKSLLHFTGGTGLIRSIQTGESRQIREILEGSKDVDAYREAAARIERAAAGL